MPKGKLAIPMDGRLGPISNPPVDQEQPHFTRSHVVLSEYYTSLDIVQAIIPDCFELEEKPVARVFINNFGMSQLGQYREIIYAVEVSYRGVKYSYVPYIYVTNEAALISGREPIGYPKLMADIEFSPMEEKTTPLISCVMSRPSNVPLMYGVFRPVSYVGRAEDLPKEQTAAATPTMISLRSIPGNPPVTELAPAGSSVIAGDVWLCKGCVSFTGYSDIDDLHRIPVIEPIMTVMCTDATLSLNLKIGTSELINLRE